MKLGTVRTWAPRLLLGVLLLVGVTAGVARAIGEATLDEPAPGWFGSRPATLARLESADCDSYSFVVLGDIQQGLNAFRHGLEFAAEVPDIRFVVACGDLVNNPTEPHYRLLFSAAAGADPGVPVLTVPGNHDSPTVYRALVGPSPWSVRIGPDLLIGVDNGKRVPGAAEMAEIEKLLRTEGVRHRFVFLHRPAMKQDKPRPGFGPFFAMLTQAGADAIFAGHAHKYEREVRDGVLHLTNGLGGDLSHDMDGTAAVAVVTVTDKGFTDRMVPIGKHAEFLCHLNDSLVAHLYAPFRGRWLWIAGVVLLLSLALLAGLRTLGAGAFVPTVALFAPALASPPSGPLLTGGYAVLGVAALISLRPGRLRLASFWLAFAAALVLARSPWLTLTAALLIVLTVRVRPALLRGPMRPAIATLSIVATILLIAAWSGSSLLLPAVSSVAALPLLRR